MTFPTVRRKRPSDVEACVAGLREVHEHDQYPWRWPTDPAAWLQPAESTMAAWVATEPAPPDPDPDSQTGADSMSSPGAGAGAERIVGHVVLRRAAGHRDGEALAAATGLDPAGLALIARLWTLPAARGRGTGRRLLAAASDEARARGLRPMLDVVSVNKGAIVLYESEGWTRVGSRPFALADGDTTDLYYYLAPADRPERT